MIDGRVITDLSLPNFTAVERRALYNQFIELLVTLHQVDYKTVGLEEGFGGLVIILPVKFPVGPSSMMLPKQRNWKRWNF